jgi:hypothetical protein
MARLGVLMRVLTVALIALVIHTLADGVSVPAAVAEPVIALLLLASVLIWRQGRSLDRDGSGM